MATEYVFRIISRDPAHPLAEKLVMEFGCDSSRTDRLIEAARGFAELLAALKTPEAVAKHIRDNAAMAMARNLLVK